MRQWKQKLFTYWSATKICRSRLILDPNQLNWIQSYHWDGQPVHTGVLQAVWAQVGMCLQEKANSVADIFILKPWTPHQSPTTLPRAWGIGCWQGSGMPGFSELPTMWPNSITPSCSIPCRAPAAATHVSIFEDTASSPWRGRGWLELSQ